MGGRETKSDRMRQMLGNLPAAQRDSLIEALGRQDVWSGHDPVIDLLGQELKKIYKAMGQTPARAPNLSRLFFAPLDPFLVSSETPQKLKGFVRRAALQPIWALIENEIAPAMVAACGMRVMVAACKKEQKQHSDILRADLLPRLKVIVEHAQRDLDDRRKLTHRLGGEGNYLDLVDCLLLFEHAERLQAFQQSLPETPRRQNAAHVKALKANIDNIVSHSYDLAPFLASLFSKALANETDLPLWAIALCGTEDARVLAAAPAAAFIEQAMDACTLHAKLTVAELSRPYTESRALQHLRDYGRWGRALRTALDLDGQSSAWATRLFETRQTLSQRLHSEFGELFPLMRRSVRTLRAFGKQPPQPPDLFDTGRLCYLLALFDAVRLYVQEFALNEIVNQARSDCTTYLDYVYPHIAEDLRGYDKSKVALAKSYAHIAVDVCRLWNGPGPAGALQRHFGLSAAV